MGKRDPDEDETAFPRGGGGGVGNNFDGDTPGANASGKRRKMFEETDEMPFGHSKSPTSSSAKEKTFVESLKYKTMRVGMKILGVVCETSERGLVVSLPNGLKGNVTRAEAGEAFYHEKTGKRKGKMMNEESDDDDDDDDDEKSDSESSDSEDETGAPPLSLQAAFQVGQLVRCVVNRLEKGKSGGKRIDLTTRVSKTCAGLTKESLADGVNVPAEVVSVEDHGFVLSFGIDGAPPGFLPRKATAPGRGLVQGSLLDVVLTGADRETKDDDENETNESEKSEKKKPKRLAPAKRNVLTVTADPKRVANAVTHETDTTSLGTLLPGMLVNARVKSVLVDGIGVNFMTYFVANCDAFHVADASSKGSVESTKVHGPATDLARTHKVGDRFRARVVFVDVETKRVGVSLRPHLIRYGGPELVSGIGKQSKQESDTDADAAATVDATDVLLGVTYALPKIGAVCETAVVRRVDASVGVLLELTHVNELTQKKTTTLGYCHISDASDGHVEKLEKVFKVGGKTKCRVLGRRPLDGISTVSCRNSVIDQPFLTLDELVPGMKVRGEVLAIESYGAMVKLAPGVKALCPPNHVSDIPGRTSSQKVKEGANLQFRVLSVDRLRKRVTVTHKKSLVKSDLTVVSSLKSAIVGTRCHGVVTGVEPYGVFVSLFGEARGLAGLQDLGLTVNQPPKEAYEVGQVVRCTVTRSDSLNVRKLKLSLIDGGDFGGGSVDREGTGFETEGGNADETTDGPDPGTVFDFVTVKSVDTETGAVRVKLPLEGGYGTVTKAHLSDCPATGTQLLESLTPGSQLGPVLVLESKSAKRVVLSRKLSLITSAKENKLPETVADLLVGGRYPGYVASVSSSGVFVRFLGRLTGLAPPSGLVSFSSGGSVSKKGKGNKPTDPTDRFQLGQTVFAKVTAVDATTATPRVSLSLSGSVNSSTPKPGNQSAALAALGLDSCLIRQVFADIDALDFLAESRGDRDADDDDEKMVLSKEAASKFTPGTKISVTVSQTREYGILGDCGLDENAVVVIGNDQLDGKKDQKKDGSVVTCVVLDVDRREGIVDCGARAGLLESVDSKKKSASKSTRGKKSETDDLQPGTNVTAVIELLKPEYMVVSLPGHGGSVGYCAGRAVNAGFGERVDTDDAWSPLGVVGETVSLTVVTDGTRNGGRLLLVADDALLGDTSDGHDGVSRNGGGGYVGGGTDHPVGAVLDAVVLEKHVQQVIVSLPGGGKARLHATEMPLTATSVSSKKKSAKGLDTSKGGYVDTATPVFHTTHEGDSISVVVCGPAGDRGTMLEVSARRSSSDAKSAFAAAAAHGSQDGGNAGVLGTAALATLEHGVLFAHAVVAQVSAQVLAVLIAPGLTVRLPRIETGCDVESLKIPLDKRFAIGARCGFLTALTSDVARKKMTATLRTLNDRTVTRGVSLPVIVTKIVPNGGGVFCQVTGTRRARAHVCDLSDAVTTNPWKKFSVGDVVHAAVVNVSEDGGEIDVSFKTGDFSSKTNPGTDTTQNSSSASSLAPGASVGGYVKNVTKGGLFVALTRNVDARVKMCNLSDTFVDDPQTVFPKGSVVSGTVLSVDSHGNVEMTLRSDGGDASAVRDGSSGAENRTPVEIGAVTMGTVRAVQTYGVFVTLDGSGRSGLCHISQFADAIIKDGLDSHVRTGERVRVKVLGVDLETAKISLGMKPSLFTTDDDDDDAGNALAVDTKKEDVLVADETDDEEDEEEADDEDEDDEDEDDDEAKDDDDEAIDADDSDSEDGDALVDDDDEDIEVGGDDEDDDDDDEAGSDDDSEAGSDSEDAAVAMETGDDGLDWDAGDKNLKNALDDDDANDDKTVLTKREKAKKKANKELALHAKELELRHRADAAPENAKEFEKALMGNPRSSFLWISYVALRVSLGAFDEAREVAERALKAVPSSDQDEKMNLWVAYLNLENAHGKPTPKDAVGKLFHRACLVANPKKLHLALAGTHERSGDVVSQTDILSNATRKYSQSAKVWIAYIRSFIINGSGDATAASGSSLSAPELIKKAIDRASQTLPKRKVVKVLVQVGLIETREGNLERGRSMFEAILRNYPRRTDIWSVYVDLEIKEFAKTQDPARCRALLERATHLELAPKAMKFLFKRFLDFERKVGDATRVEHVKQRAMEYVSSKFG